MFKWITTAVLVLSVLLFPPATLAYISQNALPGETLYPVKRILEDGILTIASLNPNTKAFFALAYSRRRFTETTDLISRGQTKSASQPLGELVIQTSQAAKDINQVSDPDQKKALVEDLSKAIEEYSKGLEEARDQIDRLDSSDNENPQIPEIPDVTTTPIQPGESPIPDQLSPTSQVSDYDAKLQQEIDEAIIELERIRAEINSELENNSSSQNPNVDLNAYTNELDQVNIEGLNDISNQTFEQYYKIIPE